MSTFEIASGATLPPIEITVFQQKPKTKKEILNLSNLDNAKVIWYGDDDIINERIMSLVDPVNGKLEYRWVAGDTDTPGMYEMYIKLEFTDGNIIFITEETNKNDKLWIRNVNPVICTP